MSATPETSPFLKTIEQLLETNNLVLYGRIDRIATSELTTVLRLLRDRYEQEATGYRGTPPPWDEAAAEWSAKVVFHAGQLILYRQHEGDELSDYFPIFPGPITPAAQLSADICLRYLPALLQHLDAIHPDDELIEILRQLLGQWPYTGLLANPSEAPNNLSLVLKDDCLRQLFVDRVIATKNEAVAERPEVQPHITAALGNHAATYWRELLRTDDNLQFWFSSEASFASEASKSSSEV